MCLSRLDARESELSLIWANADVNIKDAAQNSKMSFLFIILF